MPNSQSGDSTANINGQQAGSSFAQVPGVAAPQPTPVSTMVPDTVSLPQGVSSPPAGDPNRDYRASFEGLQDVVDVRQQQQSLANQLGQLTNQFGQVLNALQSNPASGQAQSPGAPPNQPESPSAGGATRPATPQQQAPQAQPPTSQRPAPVSAGNETMQAVQRAEAEN